MFQIPPILIEMERFGMIVWCEYKRDKKGKTGTTIGQKTGKKGKHGGRKGKNRGDGLL